MHEIITCFCVTAMTHPGISDVRHCSRQMSRRFSKLGLQYVKDTVNYLRPFVGMISLKNHYKHCIDYQQTVQQICRRKQVSTKVLPLL